jgi:hypothetical protein
MSGSAPNTYQIAFPSGVLTNSSGMVSPEWQRWFLAVWNRTGGAQGINGAYLTSQTATTGTSVQDALANAAAAGSDAETAILLSVDAESAGSAAKAMAQRALASIQAVSDMAEMALLRPMPAPPKPNDDAFLIHILSPR